MQLECSQPMKINVSLMGGLGNQLFQLALGLSLAEDDKFNLIPILGNSRRSALGRVDIDCLNLSRQVEIVENASLNSRLVSVGLGRGLRAASKKNNESLVRLVELGLPFFLGKNKYHIKFSRGLGSDLEEMSDFPVLYVGYFQSQIFSSQQAVFTKLMNLSPKHSPSVLDDFIAEVIHSNPILLHVRLTDYLSQSSFGLPSLTYYKEAIAQISKICGEVEIWVFSDDPYNALNFLPKEFECRYRLAPKFDDTVHNFELMRYFSGFIIANSSFSWWAAHLRRNRNAPVIHPWPWFRKNLHKREDFIPAEWIGLASGF